MHVLGTYLLKRTCSFLYYGEGKEKVRARLGFSKASRKDAVEEKGMEVETETGDLGKAEMELFSGTKQAPKHSSAY